MTARNVKYWLVTWTTFGTWLPGDRRGFQTWRGREYVPPPGRYAKLGEATYDPAPYRRRHEYHARTLSQPPVRLTVSQIEVASDALAGECGPAGVVGAAWALGPVHAHLLTRFGPLPIRPTAGRLKAAATRTLRRGGFPHARVWCRNVHMKKKHVGPEFRTAFAYVARHVREPDTRVVVWPGFAESLSLLPRDVREKVVTCRPTTSRRLGGKGCDEGRGHGGSPTDDFDPFPRQPR